MSSGLFSALLVAHWTPADPAVDVSEVLATCRDQATLVGDRGETRDPRLFEACAAARGLRRSDGWSWLPASPAPCVDADAVRRGSAGDWQVCLEGARFVDASGWPRIRASEVRACMAEAGWSRVDEAEWVAATRACAPPVVAAR